MGFRVLDVRGIIGYSDSQAARWIWVVVLDEVLERFGDW